MKILALITLACCILLNVAVPALSQEFNQRLTQKVDSIVTSAMETHQVPGVTLSIVRKDSLLFSSGYGFHSSEEQKAVSPGESLFRIGSITKNITALALMQLVEEGKIDLYADANDYLTSYQIDNQYERKITPYDLMTHSAGLDDHLLGGQSYEPIGPETLAAHVADQFPDQIRPPGEIWSYSSYGVALVAVMIEDVSGMLFSEYVQQHIFDPLGMNDTYFFVQDIDESKLVRNYQVKDTDLIPYETIQGLYIYSTGSIMTTAEDMASYMAVFTSGGSGIIKPQTLEMMRSTIFGHFSDQHIGWSIGFFNRHTMGNEVYYHTGGIDGNVSVMRIYPESDLAIFMGGNARGTMSNLITSVVGELEKLLLEDRSGADIPGSLKAEPDADVLKKYSGKYRSIAYSQNTVQKAGILLGFKFETDVIATDDELIIYPSDTLQMLADGRFWSSQNEQPVAFEVADGQAYMANPRGYYEKISFYDASSFQVTWVVVVLIIQVLSLLIYLVFFAVKKLRSKYKLYLNHKLTVFTALSIIVFLIAFIWILISTPPWIFFYGVPTSLKVNLLLPFVIIALVAINLFVVFFKSRPSGYSKLLRVTGIITLVSQVSFIVWMNYWNLIGFNYY
ncbi:MAG: serine hydrolase [Cyclobacteriaceae bacterium]